jgi:glycosyltransferase involved in cell wall biosynthesis
MPSTLLRASSLKALFAHDHRFIPVAGGRVLSEAQFDRGGWERYLAHFAELVVVAREGTLPRDRDPATLPVSSHPSVSFRFVPNLSSLSAQVAKRGHALAIVRQVVRECDAVIATLPTQTGLLAIQAARESDKPWMVFLTGCAWDGYWHYGTLTAKAYAPIMTWRTKRAVARAPFVYYVTKRFLQQRYPAPARVTAGISDVVIPSPDRQVLDRRLVRIDESAGRPLVFGLIGTLRGRHKGIETALDALAVVKDRLPPFEFRLLGGGDVEPWRQYARTLGMENVVRFCPTVSPGEPVLRWLDEVDIYLQPSLKEGLPRALVEAMSRGCPAIASNIAGIPELLDRRCLVRAGNPVDLATLIVSRARDVGWYREMAQRNWTVAAEYTNEVLEPRRVQFWRSFANYAALRVSDGESPHAR